ncbi:uncharacterized protein BDZ99DRAFT_459814 [Mytilinidion resinicola]|uniref:J domain-containing protein n=1 Tax=Mytilinidion resinicola TaxID=574789 RepID=A0A6A6Z057_9PEZI|nr:uncharacterized protein BDZ99DRAFT_459814 [Mytilinidion resinicola]KAF2814083.1 hypothetical protein BDZ99DRAFT_459814 [Mytilinidion resinicola]
MDEPEPESSAQSPNSDTVSNKRVRFTRPEVTGVSQPPSTAETLPHQPSPEHLRRVKAAKHVLRVRDDHYAVLGFHYTPMLTVAQLNSAKRHTLLQTHPDKLPASQTALAKEATQIVNAAFELLSNPQKKSKYDRERRQFSAQRANSFPTSSSSDSARPQPTPTPTMPSRTTPQEPYWSPPKPYNFGGFGGYNSYGAGPSYTCPSPATNWAFPGPARVPHPSGGWADSGMHGGFGSAHSQGGFMNSHSHVGEPNSRRPVCVNTRFYGRPHFLDELS